ncbi:hypothetical protein FJ365_06020 [Candidatus Dependentiae bacterium]|nr:hypothetical protein [Candidatus Dependentiae bacterium]
MNTPSDLQNPIICTLPLLVSQSNHAPQGWKSGPLLCTYSTEYEAIYEPSYDPVFFYAEEDEYEEYYEEVWDDFFRLPDSSGIGHA